MPAGLVAAYGFEEASGTTVADASGQRQHRHDQRRDALHERPFGARAVFDGVNDWVTVADATRSTSRRA